MLNRDIGFVRKGQDVMVKLDAYPFTRYGLLHGKLIGISRDAVMEEKLGQVYEAQIELKEAVILADGRTERLQPGLTATAEIKTNTRRIVDYLLSPLERRIYEAGRER
ncbi:Leukotoxin export protein LtxD [compost metagenome]